MRRTVSARGPAAPEVAWERYAVPAQWSTWAPQIRSVSYAGSRLAADTSGAVVGVGGLRVAFEVTHVDEAARQWSWRVHVGPVRLALAHAVDPDGAGSATTLVVEGPAPVVLAYAPVARLALHRLVA